MAFDIRNVKNIDDLIRYFSENLGWNVDSDDFEDIDDIAYDFTAEEIGLKEEAFAKISSLKQLQPLVDNQKWGVFCVEFDSSKFEVSALRKILSGLIPKRRNSADHAVWEQQDLLFICNWGEGNNRTIGVAHFEDKDTGLPQIKMISCAPALEDLIQINVFEERLSSLSWPKNTSNIEAWRKAWSSAFISGYRQTIKDSSALTIQLAAEAQNIRNRILSILEVESSNGYVHLLYEKFKSTLLHDMTEDDFADMYAQTVVYGLFSARCMDETQDDFSAEEAVDCIPNTNPFLKCLMQECLSSQNNSKLSFDELEISNVVDLLMHTKTDEIIKDFNRQTGGGKEDPVIHFYEEFLTAYDSEKRVQRGVYYTPQPIVNFIVRAVDDIIKKDFGYEDGLATTENKTIKIKRKSRRKVNGYHTMISDEEHTPAIQVLDPATGTGTFLRQTILAIFESFKSNNSNLSEEEFAIKWTNYVNNNLLNRIHGFEIMMAPYAVAHMKLAMVLKDTGYLFDSDSRLKVYLTNTLEEPGDSNAQMSFFSDPLAIESINANAIKKNTGINVVIGNPPYSGISANNADWIAKLIDDYKYKDGEYFNERKHWLNDDYVKFIRYSENLISKCDFGIVAFITNNGFLDNPTFRFMRHHLMRSYSQIYIINLHGSTKKREVAPNGDSDENVFDIQQGVSINIFVKKETSKELSEVYYHDIYGGREDKYAALSKLNIYDIPQISPDEKFYSFIPFSTTDTSNYNEGFSLSEVFPVGSTGYLSGKDKVFIADNNEQLKTQLTEFYGESVDDKFIIDLSYRPFDRKVAFFVPNKNSLSKAITLPACYRSRYNVMQHFSRKDNLALLVGRQGLAVGDVEWNLSFVSDSVPDLNIFYRGGENVFPVHLFYDEMGIIKKRANIATDFAKTLFKKTGIRIKIDESSEGFDMLQLVDYIYGILHSHKYRNANRDLLKLDLPKIPYPHSEEYFLQISQLGCKLRQLHLMKHAVSTNEFILSDTQHNYHIIEKCSYKDNKLYINKTDYFSGVTKEMWEFYIGGYQPLQKWLKDRKGQQLCSFDMNHYRKMLGIIKETINTMDTIDSLIEL